jgi:hypothetical protein
MRGLGIKHPVKAGWMAKAPGNEGSTIFFVGIGALQRRCSEDVY